VYAVENGQEEIVNILLHSAKVDVQHVNTRNCVSKYFSDDDTASFSFLLM
jgi:hypothetical protein